MNNPSPHDQVWECPPEAGTGRRLARHARALARQAARGDIAGAAEKIYRAARAAPGRLRARREREAVGARLRPFGRPYKLHLGCGQVKLEGWVNIDVEASSGAADLTWDLARGIPCDDASCELIYCEHMLEHLTPEQGVRFLGECRRVLHPGGVLRVAMPSLDVLIEKLARGDWRDQEWLRLPEYQFIQTRAEMANIFFRWWGHQWIYDQEELRRRLGEAGFITVRAAEWGRSEVPELNCRETRPDSLLICEAMR